MNLANIHRRLEHLEHLTSTPPPQFVKDTGVEQRTMPPLIMQLPRTMDDLMVISWPWLSNRIQLLLTQLQEPQQQAQQDQDQQQKVGSCWTMDHVYWEYELNQVLGPIVATRALLSDVDSALQAFLEIFDTAHEDLKSLAGRTTMPCNEKMENDVSEQLTSRQEKRLFRIVSCGLVALQFFSVATFVAVHSLEMSGVLVVPGTETINPPPPLLSPLAPMQEGASSLSQDEMLKLVERTRMVVSTVATFLTVNAERALKAIDGYTKGKLFKKLLIMVENKTESRKSGSGLSHHGG